MAYLDFSILPAPSLQLFSSLNHSSATALLLWLSVKAQDNGATLKPARVFNKTSFSVPTGRLLKQTL